MPRVLVFCPPIVIDNWKKEWLMHSSIPAEKITGLSGAGKKRLEVFRGRAYKFTGFIADSVPHIFITNYEALNMEELYEEILRWDPEVVIFDECHRLKDYKSKRSKLAERLVNGRMKLAKGAAYPTGPRPQVFMLSGSPVLNSPMDIFQQFKILDAGKTFGYNFFAFRGKFFRDRNAGMNRQNYFPDWVARQGAEAEISNLMQHNSMRVLKKDCMDLPPLVQKVISVELAPEQRRMYDSMLKDYVMYFQGTQGQEHVASATLAITKGLRLMQIASGYVKTVDLEEVPLMEGRTPKQEALKELLEELTPNHKVLIWAVWKQNYKQIKEVLDELSIPYVEVHGEIAQAQKMAAVESFNQDDRVRVFLGHPGSGGIGINLVAASYSIFYSRTFSLEQDMQAEARNYRGGSERHDKVTRIDLVAKGTIEEKIVERLACKEEIGEKVLRAITLELKK